MLPLGKIQRIDLRDCWKKEDTEFTPWLAQEENIALLSNVIGIELEVVGQEQNVGPFRADILCKNVATDQYVLIENQLEITDHTHLGQIMTYAAGLNAVTIIWIARKFDDEHRAALDWLNSITDSSFNFFGIEVGLIKIDDSKAAPMFDIVAQPNDWSKKVKDSTKNGVQGELTEIKKAQLEYWNQFNEFLQQRPSKFFNPQSGLPQHWMNIAIGKSGYCLSCQVNSEKKIIGVNFVINNSPEDKTNYDALLKYKEQFNNLLPDEKVEWRRMDQKKQSNICVFTQFDFQDKATRDGQYQWLKETVETFERFFREKIKNL